MKMELFSRTPQRHGKRESSESGLKKTGLKVGCGGTPEDTPRASVMVLIRADNCFSRKRLVLRWGLLPTQDINPEQFCKKKKKKSFIFFKKKILGLGSFLHCLPACFVGKLCPLGGTRALHGFTANGFQERNKKMFKNK